MSDEVPQSTPPEQGPGGDRPAAPRVSLGKSADVPPASPQDSVPGQGPGPGAVHGQQGPASQPAGAVPSAWAPPTTGGPSPATPFAPPAAPFAAPAPTPPPNPYAPAPPNPFAPPAAPAHPYAPPVGQHPGPEPVPPPPIAPDGPGQVPYGYPGTAAVYGWPGGGPQQPYPAPYPGADGYGWPGMQVLPSNGMGTAALVCGILATVGFVLWPVALVLGILAIVFGAIGRGKAKRGEATNPGTALAGLICGAAGVVLALGLVAYFIAAGT